MQYIIRQNAFQPSKGKITQNAWLNEPVLFGGSYQFWYGWLGRLKSPSESGLTGAFTGAGATTVVGVDAIMFPGVDAANEVTDPTLGVWAWWRR